MTSNGKKRPTKLDRFRLTSPWEHLVAQAAEVFGGTARPWTNQSTKATEFEVTIEEESLPVVIPPGEVFDQWYELWTGGGCSKRCDGLRQVLVDAPCSCPPDPMDRQELASKGNACKPTTRVRLMIPDLADVGIWRLESHGFHAAAELGGAAALIATASRAGAMIPADLRLAHREGSRRPGVPRRTFYVPAISFRGELGPVLAALGILEEGATMPRLLGVEARPEIASGGSPALPAPSTPFDPAPVERATIPAPPALELPSQEPEPAPDPVEVDVEIDPFVPPQAADPGSLDLEPGPPPAPEDLPQEEQDPESYGSLTGPQMIAVRMKDAGIHDQAEKLALCSAVVGRKLGSSKDLKPAEIRTILAVLSDPSRLSAAAVDAMDYLPPQDFEETVHDTRTPAPQEAKETPPPSSAPIPATARESSSSRIEDPEGWDPDRWRAYLKTKKVRVPGLMKEAARLARKQGKTIVPASLGDLAGSGLTELLCGYVEEQSEDGRA